jgi:hypothetical protein
MENNLGLQTLPKTRHMTSAAKVLATYPKTDPPTLVGAHTHMGLLFSPISPPLPNLPTQRGGPLKATLAFREVLLEIRLWGLPSGNLS